ncbi:MAG: hypothetical protein GY847_29050 [Proteobacteria bacterium]|nr:hypothetical protein [Pseudomonadota bacterium]
MDKPTIEQRKKLLSLSRDRWGLKSKSRILRLLKAVVSDAGIFQLSQLNAEQVDYIIKKMDGYPRDKNNDLLVYELTPLPDDSFVDPPVKDKK